MRIVPLIIEVALRGGSIEELQKRIEEALEKSPRKCFTCGKRLTSEDILNSQGFDCTECFPKSYVTLLDKKGWHIPTYRELFSSFLEVRKDLDLASKQDVEKFLHL